MPVKTQNHKSKKYAKHYAKVYWPYLPLILVMVSTLIVGHSFVNRSQRSVLAYATNVSAPGLLQATNSEREQNGDVDLSDNASLDAAAQAKANDMVKRNYWSHITPDGKTPWAFIDATGYHYQSAGENLAYGFASSNETINGWMNSPAHRENLLNPAYQTVGFGVANSENFQKTGQETIVVALYAQPVSAVASPAPANSSGTALAFTTSSTDNNQPATTSINKAQALTNGRLPWIGFALGLIMGGGLVFLVLQHSLKWHRTRKRGEHYKIQHPLRDVTLVATVVLCLLLIQNVGVIK